MSRSNCLKTYFSALDAKMRVSRLLRCLFDERYQKVLKKTDTIRPYLVLSARHYIPEIINIFLWRSCVGRYRWLVKYVRLNAWKIQCFKEIRSLFIKYFNKDFAHNVLGAKIFQIRDEEASASFDYKDGLLETTSHDEMAVEWKTIYELLLTAQNSNAPKNVAKIIQGQGSYKNIPNPCR
jgi:hypothetical protein